MGQISFFSPYVSYKQTNVKSNSSNFLGSGEAKVESGESDLYN
jgi:hypothetical protein